MSTKVADRDPSNVIDPPAEPQPGPSTIASQSSHVSDPTVAHAPFKLWNPPTETRPACRYFLDNIRDRVLKPGRSHTR